MSPKMVNPRDIAGKTEEGEEEEVCMCGEGSDCWTFILRDR